MDSLVIYGAGRLGQRVLGLLRELKIEVKAVLDCDEQKVGTEIYGCIVEPPEAHVKYRDALLYIAVADIAEQKNIRRKLSGILVSDTLQEISYRELILKSFEESSLIHDFLSTLDNSKNKEPSVLFGCLNGLELGGIEAWTKDLCCALIRSGLEQIYILTDDKKYDLPPELHGHILSACIPNSPPFSINSIQNLIKAIAGKFPCKIITSQADDIMLAAYLLKRVFPNMVEIISVIHGGEGRIYSQYMDFRHCVDVFVGVSKDIKRDMILRGIEEDRIYSMTIPFICPDTLNRTYTLSVHRPIRIAYAGRLDAMRSGQKRMDLLLRLIQELSDRDISFIFDLAGDGVARSEMEQYVKECNHGAYVRFLGKIDRALIPSFWQHQDICVNMADFEGRSISICEAMGNGVVPVVTDTSGVRDDIVDGVNGYIVPIGDYMTAADRIEYMTHHREMLPEMGNLAHEMVYPQSMMEMHVKFWKDLLLTGKTVSQS